MAGLEALRRHGFGIKVSREPGIWKERRAGTSL